MKKYYLNLNMQPNGDYEVHTLGCHKFPSENVRYLGEYSNCQEAVRKAKEFRSKVNGCIHCCSPCHTS